MSKVFRVEKIDPGKLTREERQTISKKLYAIHEAVFSGLDEEEFDHYVVNSPAQDTKLYVYRNKQGEIVGYFGVHRFEKSVKHNPLIVFRAEVGLLHGYRQSNANLSYWLLEATKFKLLHPNKRVYFLYVPVSPSFYAMVAKHTYQVYPKYNQAIPAHMQALMIQLAQQFGLEQVNEANPLVRRVGWVTKVMPHETEYWRCCSNPHIRFYIDTNPNFTKGCGLLTIIPLTFLNLALSLPAIIFHALKKKLRS